MTDDDDKGRAQDVPGPIELGRVEGFWALLLAFAAGMFLGWYAR